MQNDTISRSALVADLESFKVQMGDPVFRFLVDRVIERVKAQPGVSRQVEIAVKPSPNTGKVFERRGLTWFPDLSDSGAVAEYVEDLLHEGWSPCNWSYDHATDPADYGCFGFLFERELR